MTELPADMKAHNRKVIEEYRANQGAGGRPLLLLTTTGARTGEPRTTPMMYVPERDRLFDGIVAKYPFFVDHQAGVTRTIPVVVLARRT
jgi:hypothetical protein